MEMQGKCKERECAMIRVYMVEPMPDGGVVEFANDHHWRIGPGDARSLVILKGNDVVAIFESGRWSHVISDPPLSNVRRSAGVF